MTTEFISEKENKREAALSPSYDDLARLDRQYCWHPFTQMQDWEREEMIVIEKGDGVYLEDVEGRRYIDGVSSLWCNVHGHRRPEIDEAIRDQLGKIAHSTFLGLSNVPAILLAEKLIAIAPRGLSRVFYSDSGSEAVEIALKIAYQYWQQKEPGRGEGGGLPSKEPVPFKGDSPLQGGQSPSKGTGSFPPFPSELERTLFVHVENAYHGDTLGAVSVGGIDLFHAAYRPLLFETRSAYAPYCYRCKLGLHRATCRIECFGELEQTVRRFGRRIAAIVIEPLMQGAAGMIDQPPEFLIKLKRLADEYEILLIFDEVATGIGRTGRMFAAEHVGITPDILTIAKGLTGGYLPLAATLVKEEIYEAFLGEYHERKTFFHGHTYTANALAARAALANLEIFEKEKTLERLAPKIEFMKRRLEDFRPLAHVGDIRQVGFMAGIELVRDKKTKEPYPWEEKIGIQVCLAARGRGIWIRPLGNVIVLMPPLVIPAKVLTELLGGVYESIREVTETVKD